MKYMLIMRTTDEALAASAEVDFEQIIAEMGAYNESMVKAGVLAGGDGLTDAAEGFVVEFTDEEPLVTDGPYGETKELFNGFWILDVASAEEAAEWARKAPLGKGNKLEVRRIHGVEDFPADNEWIKKEMAWKAEYEAKNS
ncbi:YciI family protein [Nocardia harenae]|uniref:YciI family protein n=1 Tax=Nocardia harenae TaxID=358707 RepID=UPI00082AFA87|nr:YciI family protein [Nocardia harenae]